MQDVSALRIYEDDRFHRSIRVIKIHYMVQTAEQIGRLNTYCSNRRQFLWTFFVMGHLLRWKPSKWNRFKGMKIPINSKRLSSVWRDWIYNAPLDLSLVVGFFTVGILHVLPKFKYYSLSEKKCDNKTIFLATQKRKTPKLLQVWILHLGQIA